MLRQRGQELGDGRWVAKPAERNRGAILEVLQRVVPPRAVVLEIASGTGQHAVHFARAMPSWSWQPSDPDPDLRASIAQWSRVEGLANVAAPLALDVHEQPWPVERADAVVCINMIHVAPWSATPALCSGAAAVLPAGGVLILYGPYRRGGRHTAPSNESFDADLRARDPRWGVRDLEQVAAEAARAGLDLEQTVEMPANNLSVVFRRRAA